MALKPEYSNKKDDNKKAPEFNWQVALVILLLLLIIGVPLAISVWDVGTPVKGYHTT